MALSWQKIEIETDKKELKQAVAPIIISASRSTDVPAFHSKWFFNRLERGYVTWINPFNRKTPQYISFKNTRVIVFWTKNPKPIIPYLKELDNKNIQYYFQFTVNDYDKEGFEPNVPPLEKRIQTFYELSEKIGKEKVIWRFDPLILTNNLSVRDLLKKIWYLGNKLINHTDKLVFSYADILEYRKVQNNLIREIDFFNKNNIQHAEFTNDKKIEFADGLKKILVEWRKINSSFTIATCGEDINLEKFNIEHNKCIDDGLMIKLFNQDKVLMDFLGYTPPDKTLFGVQSRPNLKDKGQRLACGCIFSKDIGSYNTCKHLCVYCYANTSKKVVEKNLKMLSIDSESILPNEINNE